MSFFVHDDVLDGGGLDKIATCTRMTACSSAPSVFADISGASLADVTLTAGDGNGDYTIADGDVSGRKLTIAEQSSIAPSASGSATHVSLDDGATLLYVTEAAGSLSTGTNFTFPQWSIEIEDPQSA